MPQKRAIRIPRREQYHTRLDANRLGHLLNDFTEYHGVWTATCIFCRRHASITIAQPIRYAGGALRFTCKERFQSRG